ncbi:AMIN domain-containing protein [Hydrogenimonas sp.]
MKRIVGLCIMGFLLLHARENPFEPVIDDTVLPVTSNKIEKAPPFEQATVKLPPDARVLTSLAVYYQSIDGSIKKKIVSIDRSIDWHKALVLSQKEPGEKGKPEKLVIDENGKALETKTSPTREKALRKFENTEKTQKSVFKPFPFVSVEIEGKRVHIVTKDPKIRSLHLVDPFKIAIDFKRDTGRFLTRHKEIGFPPYKAIELGNHIGFYRIVVIYDAPYKYRIRQTEDGYLIELR